MKKVYELSSEEVILVENWRKGKIFFDDALWMKLTQKESEVIELWRKIEFGTLVLEFIGSEPQVSRLLLEFRHGKLTKQQGALSIMPHLKEKYG